MYLITRKFWPRKREARKRRQLMQPPRNVAQKLTRFEPLSIYFSINTQYRCINFSSFLYRYICTLYIYNDFMQAYLSNREYISITLLFLSHIYFAFSNISIIQLHNALGVYGHSKIWGKPRNRSCVAGLHFIIFWWKNQNSLTS